MTTLVVYESTFGNTARIAEAIAARLGARMLPVSEARPLDLEGADLLLIGGPAQTHGVPRRCVNSWTHSRVARSSECGLPRSTLVSTGLVC